MMRADPTPPIHRHPRSWLPQALLFGAALVASVFALFPIAWGVLTSVKPQEAIFRSPPQWLPQTLTANHFRDVLFGSNMPVYFANSLGVVVATVLVSLALSSMGAYAMTRFRFRGKNLLAFLMLMTSMIPTVAIIVPLYTITSKLHVHDSLITLVVAFTALQIPITLWLLRGHFESISLSLDEAAMIDGCNRFQVFTKIVLPLTRPGLAAAAVPIWIYVWNDFIIPISLTSSDEHRVVSIGLYYYITVFGIEWGRLMAAVTLVLLPSLVCFAFLQRSFVSGLSAGSIKG